MRQTGRLWIVPAAALAIGAVGGRQAARAQPAQEKVVALVNGDSITEGEFYTRLQLVRAQDFVVPGTPPTFRRKRVRPSTPISFVKLASRAASVRTGASSSTPTSDHVPLAIYAKGRGGDMPVRDKKALVAELRQAVAEATAFCKARGVDLTRIEGTSAEKFERAQAVVTLRRPQRGDDGCP